MLEGVNDTTLIPPMQDSTGVGGYRLSSYFPPKRDGKNRTDSVNLRTVPRRNPYILRPYFSHFLRLAPGWATWYGYAGYFASYFAVSPLACLYRVEDVLLTPVWDKPPPHIYRR